MHLLHLLFAHFKQSCSENTGAYKPVRFPAPFVITTVDYYVLLSLNMSSYLIISVDIYTVPVLLHSVMTINWLNWTELLVNFVRRNGVRNDLCDWFASIYVGEYDLSLAYLCNHLSLKYHRVLLDFQVGYSHQETTNCNIRN